MLTDIVRMRRCLFRRKLPCVQLKLALNYVLTVCNHSPCIVEHPIPQNTQGQGSVHISYGLLKARSTFNIPPYTPKHMHILTNTCLLIISKSNPPSRTEALETSHSVLTSVTTPGCTLSTLINIYKTAREVRTCISPTP